MGWGEATPEQSTCAKSNGGRTKDAPPPCSICFFILNSQCNEYREGFWVGEKQRTFPGNTSWESSSRVSALRGILCGFHMGSGFCGFDRMSSQAWGRGCSALRLRALKMTCCVTRDNLENFSLSLFYKCKLPDETDFALATIRTLTSTIVRTQSKCHRGDSVGTSTWLQIICTFSHDRGAPTALQIFGTMVQSRRDEIAVGGEAEGRNGKKKATWRPVISHWFLRTRWASH